jgi:c-di-GMP-binding flagellar brake protein YcgR
MPTRKTKEAETLAILRDVCISLARVELRLIGDRNATEYRSRFLQLDEYADEPTVTIEAPKLKGETIILPLDREVEISFLHKGRPNLFVTQVAGHGRTTVGRDIDTPSLVLPVPDEISIDEKRSFYRVQFDEDRAIEVKLGILADEKGESQRIRAREKGTITTIGGNGLGFRMPEGKSLLLNAGTRVQLKLRLAPGEKELKLLAVVRFRHRRPNAREVFFGVEFLDIDTDIKYKQSVNRILRFIAEEQRRYLASRSHLNE